MSGLYHIIRWNVEKVDLPEGTEVSVTILETPTTNSADGLRRSAGGWKGLIEPMVLVSDKPDNYIGILQTKFRDREGHEARRIGL